MPAVERKPENSAIEQVVDGDSLTLRWDQPDQPAHGLLIAYSVVVLSLVGYWELRHVNLAVQNQGNFTCFSLMLVLVFVLHLVHLIRLFRPMTPETITLSSDCLRHDTGRAFFLSPLKRVRLPNGRRIIFGMTPRHICKIPIQDLGRLQFGGYAGRRIIQYSSGRLHFEIGQFLSEADREWLMAVLRAWRTAAAGA